MRKHIANQRGAAILVILSLMLLFGLLATVAVDTATTEIDMSFNQVHYDQALYVAQAGIKRSLVALQDDFAWRDGYLYESFSPGEYTTVVVDSSHDPSYGDTVVVRSTGVVSSTPSNLEAWIVQDVHPVYNHALYAKDSVVMDKHSATDSYNSDSTYAASTDTTEGSIGSNGKIRLLNQVVVAGDATSATPGGISITGAAVVRGDTTTKEQATILDPIPDETFSEAAANNNNATGIAGIYSWKPGPKDLFVDGNKSVTLQSGTYFFNNITLDNAASIKLAAGAKVTIYCTGNIWMDNQSKVNALGIPANLQIYPKGGKCSVQNSAVLNGVIYGPNTDLSIINQAQVFGTCVARYAYVSNLVSFHHDKAVGKKLKGGKVHIVAWREL